MALVRSKGNKSTEWIIRAQLVRRKIRGWELHPSSIIGCPDFYFSRHRLCVFIDGCFWHACPKCKRKRPSGNRDYWVKKIRANIKRTRMINRKLRSSGYRVVRIWECELRSHD